MDVKKKRINEGSFERNSKNDTKRKTAKFLKDVFFGMMYALFGYFLGGATLPYSATPFGIAFLAASDKHVFYIYAGLCLYAWQTDTRILLLGVYSVVLLLRILSRLMIDTPWKKGSAEEAGELTIAQFYPELFSEHIALRAVISGIGAVAIGIYRLVEGGMMFYDMYGAIISTVVAPLFVLLISGLFVRNSGKYRRLISFIALAFALIYFLGDSRIYGVSLSALGCMFVTLYITRRGGTVLGIISGGILGLAVAIDLVPLFAFTALVAGMLYNISVSLAVFGGMSVAIAWGIYTRGLGILNGLVSAIVAASVAFIVWDKIFYSEKLQVEEKVDRRSDEGNALLLCELDRARAEDAKKRLRRAGESFRSMSELLTDISKKLQTPGASDLKQICDNAFDASCVSCENRPLCWREKYRQTSDSLGNLCKTLQSKGSLCMDDADEALVMRCSRLPDILSEINHNTFLHTREILEGDRTEVFALDYAAVADLIDKTAETDDEEYLLDSLLSEKICRELRGEGIEISSAVVWGKRRRMIALSGKDRDTLSANRKEIYGILSDICPFPTDEGVMDHETAVLRFAEKETLSIITAQRNLCAEGEDKYCGDTSGMFGTGDGRFYSFISDGMGAGREAAITSGIVGLFIRKFLSGGSSCESALKLINGFLRNRGNGSIHECSATVDIMELDLICKKACFYKSGAAPTYVFRNGSLFKLRSHTVPVGIIKEIDTRRIDFDVSGGDVIVMVSDGVTDGKEECGWLFDLLRSQGESATPERLADLVVKYAKAEGATDDISVMVIKVA